MYKDIALIILSKISDGDNHPPSTVWGELMPRHCTERQWLQEIEDLIKCGAVVETIQPMVDGKCYYLSDVMPSIDDNLNCVRHIKITFKGLWILYVLENTIFNLIIN